MKNITIDQIDKYITENKEPETFELDYGGFQVEVRASLSIAEQNSFIQEVFDNAYIDAITPSALNADVAFDICFLKYFTNIDLPVKTLNGEEVIDSEKAYKIVSSLRLFQTATDKSDDLLALIHNLKKHVKEKIEFQNQKLIMYCMRSAASDEAIENVNLLLNNGLDVMNMFMDKLQNGGNLFGSIGDLAKNFKDEIANVAKQIANIESPDTDSGT